LFRHGIESSMAVIDNYGFVADNSGSILCLNLKNMEILWNIDNYDDTDATIMIDEENLGEFFLYIGNEVDDRPSPDTSHFRKICAKTGEEIWRFNRVCYGSMLNGKVNSGGILASPVLGKHKGKDLVFCIFARSDKQNRSDLVAVNKYTGKEKYSIKLDAYSWSSPADFYDEDGNMYLFFTDVSGTIYMIDALTGEMLFKESTDFCFEASPVILNNNVIIASRGTSVLCYEIK
ncbi:MAG: PQQ-like beta-propeller repeat protein, partial [Bacteroidales bacterium]|nr:PQQ-like beta-propeller repeat protein [Bacteroidales bacterium]